MAAQCLWQIERTLDAQFYARTYDLCLVIKNNDFRKFRHNLSLKSQTIYRCNQILSVLLYELLKQHFLTRLASFNETSNYISRKFENITESHNTTIAFLKRNYTLEILVSFLSYKAKIHIFHHTLWLSVPGPIDPNPVLLHNKVAYILASRKLLHLNPHSTGRRFRYDSKLRSNDADRSRNGKSVVEAQLKRQGRRRSVSESSWSPPHGDCFDLLKIYVATSAWTRSATDA